MFFITITGPTGVGKTALVDDLARQLSFPIEVINADTGQLYTPLSIGTAKPNLEQVAMPHHLFNVISSPEDYTATQYREAVLTLMKQISSRGAVPVVVGGSGFYIATLFYPPALQQIDEQDFSGQSTEELWDLLATIDTARAMHIHKNDRYRIERALQIYYQTGTLPSTVAPAFAPPGSCVIYFLTRAKEDLHERINKRVLAMLHDGWVEEVVGLPEEWHQYLLKKKLIGYPEIIRYLQAQEVGEVSDDAYENLVERIAQKTRGYAKRQLTFWKALKKRLEKSDPDKRWVKAIKEIDLTEQPAESYSKKLSKELEQFYTGSEGYGT